jgi:hypothetical protein
MRWSSDASMVQALNEFIRANWEAIRTELALHGEYASGGDAGSAIGEGFVNSGSAATPVSTFVASSLFKIRIKLIEGPPIDYFIVTGFPSPMGIQ